MGRNGLARPFILIVNTRQLNVGNKIFVLVEISDVEIIWRASYVHKTAYVSLYFYAFEHYLVLLPFKNAYMHKANQRDVA